MIIRSDVPHRLKWLKLSYTYNMNVDATPTSVCVKMLFIYSIRRQAIIENLGEVEVYIPLKNRNVTICPSCLSSGRDYTFSGLGKLVITSLAIPQISTDTVTCKWVENRKTTPTHGQGWTMCVKHQQANIKPWPLLLTKNHWTASCILQKSTMGRRPFLR